MTVDREPSVLARTSDPETSHAAARSARRFAASQCAEILSVLREGVPVGAEQIGAHLEIEPYAIRKRLADLANNGLARPTDQTRVTRTGRAERIWEAVK